MTLLVEPLSILDQETLLGQAVAGHSPWLEVVYECIVLFDRERWWSVVHVAWAM